MPTQARNANTLDALPPTPIGDSMTVTTPRLCKCGKPVQKLVVYINRRTRNENSRTEMCDEHVQQEITLAATGLSMVDIDILPLP